MLLKKTIRIVIVSLFFIALWAVFSFVCPGFLAMKERIGMFLCDRTFLSSYFWKPGCLSVISGDFLTQFLAMTWAGPLLVTSLLAIFWAGLRLSLKTVGIPAPGLISLLPVAVQAILAVNVSYPLAMLTGPIFIVWIFAACAVFSKPWARRSARIAVVLVSAAIATFAIRGNECKIDLKTQNFSPKTELDYKIYFLACDGKWDRVIEIGLENPYQSNVVSYYYNVALSHKDMLPEGLLKAYQPLYHALFFPMKPGTTFFQQLISIDALRAAGDYPQALHSAMLAQTFSPRQKSARVLYEMVDLCFANGDYDAAERYLQMLEMTVIYRRWAKNGLKLLEDVESLTIRNDYADELFMPNDYRHSLSIIARSPKNGKAATDYLLCHYLLDKNLLDFRRDYDSFYLERYDLNAVPEIYQQALLMTFDPKEPLQLQIDKYKIDDSVVEFSSRFIKGDELQMKQSYWFYYKYAQPAQ